MVDGSMILMNSLLFALFVLVLTGLVSGFPVLLATHEADAHKQIVDKSRNNNDGTATRNSENVDKSRNNNDGTATRNSENVDKSKNNNNDPNMRSSETQNIDCGGNLSTCQNVLTNIVCSHVTYCIIGNTTPFLMANPN
jgi:hypothetical protein